MEEETFSDIDLPNENAEDQLEEKLVDEDVVFPEVPEDKQPRGDREQAIFDIFDVQEKEKNAEQSRPSADVKFEKMGYTEEELADRRKHDKIRKRKLTQLQAILINQKLEGRQPAKDLFEINTEVNSFMHGYTITQRRRTRKEIYARRKLKFQAEDDLTSTSVSSSSIHAIFDTQDEFTAPYYGPDPEVIQNAPKKTVILTPGWVGIALFQQTGFIQYVDANAQESILDLNFHWALTKLDGQRYDYDLYLEKRDGEDSFEAEFTKYTDETTILLINRRGKVKRAKLLEFKGHKTRVAFTKNLSFWVTNDCARIITNKAPLTPGDDVLILNLECDANDAWGVDLEYHPEHEMIDIINLRRSKQWYRQGARWGMKVVTISGMLYNAATDLQIRHILTNGLACKVVIQVLKTIFEQ